MTEITFPDGSIWEIVHEETESDGSKGTVTYRILRKIKDGEV